jgi:hypothetical protein
VIEWRKLASPWLYTSAFFEKRFEKRKDNYVDLRLQGSTKGDWESWIKFSWQGVVLRSLETEKRCEKLLALHRDFHGRLKEEEFGDQTWSTGFSEVQ